MPSLKKQQVIEEKKDHIEELLEEMVLDVVISLLRKRFVRDKVFPYHCYRMECEQRDDIPF